MFFVLKMLPMFDLYMMELAVLLKYDFTSVKKTMDYLFAKYALSTIAINSSRVNIIFHLLMKNV